MYTMNATTLYQSAKAPDNYFKPGPSWPSFENFRVSGVGALGEIHSGRIGLLHVRGAQYRIISESDFQHLLGLATEVDRLREGLKVVICAARVVAMHKDELSIETLTAALSMIVKVPELPVRSDFGYIEPEGLPESVSIDDDEVELDNILRPSTNV
jgi:hypothetical protein